MRLARLLFQTRKGIAYVICHPSRPSLFFLSQLGGFLSDLWRRRGNRRARESLHLQRYGLVQSGTGNGRGSRRNDAHHPDAFNRCGSVPSQVRPGRIAMLIPS